MKQFAHAMARIAEGVGPLALLEIQHYVSLCSKKLNQSIARVQAVEEKVESQMKRTSEEVDRILVETDRIVQAVVENNTILRSKAAEQNVSRTESGHVNAEGASSPMESY